MDNFKKEYEKRKDLKNIKKITKDNKDYLVFEYKNNKDEEYEIKINGKRKYILQNENERTIIENQSQIDEKIKNEDYNFNYYIFLCEVDLEEVKFVKEATSS